MIRIHPWPFDHRGALAIRDDDLNYFTRPETLTAVYAQIWDKIPISLSVIPCIRASGDVPLPSESIKDGRLYPIGGNQSLCDFLREKTEQGYVSVSQHGYTHESFDARPEFCLNDLAQLTYRIQAGRRLLQETFGIPVRVFIPPHGRVSREAALTIVNEGMNVARDCSYSQLFRSAVSVNNLPMLAGLFARNPLVWRHPINPRLTLLKTHAEMIQSYMLDSHTRRRNTLEEMKQEFVKVLQAEDLYYVVTHHWDFFAHEDGPDQNMLEALNTLVDLAAQSGVWITTLEGIAEWIEAFRSINVSMNRHEIVITCPRKINGFTISAKGTVKHDGLLKEVGENKFILDLEEGKEVRIHV